MTTNSKASISPVADLAQGRDNTATKRLNAKQPPHSSSGKAVARIRYLVGLILRIRSYTRTNAFALDVLWLLALLFGLSLYLYVAY